VHALSNLLATGLFGASWYLRRKDHRAAGRQFSLLGYLVAMLGAYLGGHMVFAQRIGVNHTNDEAGPKEFTPVVPVAELEEGRLRKAEVRGVPVLLVRRGDRILAMVETCAHLGGPLSEGWLVEDSVVCPWHQSRYRLEDGQVLDGPSTYTQPCFETRVRNGQVEVRAARRQPQTV
jgi:nitrite reductase/ring-hydroxylating ferredoxin subunit